MTNLSSKWEIALLQKINRTYRLLNLSYRRAATAVALMLLTSILEMSGLSILYPLVLALGGNGAGATSKLSIPFFSTLDPTYQIATLFAGVALVYVVKNVALYFTYEYNINFAVYYYKNLIRGLYWAHVNRSLLDFKKESAGSLSNIICVQSEKLVDGSIRPMLVVIAELFLLVGITGLLLFINPLLMIAVVMACGGAGALYFILLRSKALKWGKHQMEAASSLQEIVGNTAAGIGEIKVFGKERRLTDLLYNFATEKTRMFHHLEMYQQGPRYIAESVFIVTVVLFFTVLLMLGHSPSVLLAQFSVIAAASFRILPSINRIVHSYSTYSFNVGPSSVLLDAILESSILESTSDKPHLQNEEHSFAGRSIQLKNLSFKYPGAHKPILTNVEMGFSGGERVGLIGDSGSGKSTLIKILAGLYKPSAGQVSVDGFDVERAMKSWQSSIGYVPQESFIMPGSIRDNVTFSENVGASDEKIWWALSTVGLAAFVQSLPEKLETRIGERGVGLSGGQKQLLCLARALYRNPKVLLLDEPTASLDSFNEKTVLDAIRNLPEGTTVIMASHKHYNFRGFDRLYICERQGSSFLELTREKWPVDILEQQV